ncbi:3-oxoacyl-ACP synthase [Rhodococcus sp. RS1C4]|nr:3-oxoacyl-ACP synthase [Rhodococcus sp. RS1C4]OZD10943.1 3-oxoacyl-ACP synthase [Rhodococcus sp. 06-156-4C]OZD14114.1 3-oxoacyl-ACP synthase [Rhodococcus sp. 06-156-3C]OZD25009.1 3-oxoacyl-ACP synthase [Rhodococcus sp. 06-156-4a]OZD29461.1 3-oxoacyl-ACP synthase [Rhodococcus sp. 06-156-3b]OZD36729.1 3-oxoacyl-ACP synthase [Rhodococcus sp. 06-156-3]OZF71337.1 3-oxoacyl-ACP synthase [Rhodococcus sp. 06-156-4]
MNMHPVVSVTVGHFADAVPPRIVDNAELCATLDTDAGWIEERTGILSRRFLDSSLAASDLALDAARKALRSSGSAAADIDAIVLATANPDQPFPSTALTVAQALGATRAVPIDLTAAACSGGLLAIEVASSMIGLRYRTILVLAVEVFSRQTDPNDRTTRIFFGDAAGAAVVTAAPASERGIRSVVLSSELDMSVGIRAGGSRRPADAGAMMRGEQYIYMDGPRVWKLATTLLPEVVRQAVSDAGMPLSDIDNFCFHQANRNIVHDVMDTLGVDRSRAPITLDRLGNTGAASIFTVLAYLEREGRTLPGHTTVIATIGAGFIWGAMVVVH